jgi:hypothetical protein
MKIEFRIKKHSFTFAKDFYVAEYKISFMPWLKINTKNNGRFFCSHLCWCDTKEEAEDRINTLKKNIERVKEWWYRKIEII